MRTNEERIIALHISALKLEKERRIRRVISASAAGFVMSLATVIILALLMPAMVEKVLPVSSIGGLSASIFTGSSILGFFVIGFVAFFLGVTVTVFCFRLRKWQEEKDRETFHDRDS